MNGDSQLEGRVSKGVVLKAKREGGPWPLEHLRIQRRVSHRGGEGEGGERRGGLVLSQSDKPEGDLRGRKEEVKRTCRGQEDSGLSPRIRNSLGIPWRGYTMILHEIFKTECAFVTSTGAQGKEGKSGAQRRGNLLVLTKEK